MASSDQLSAIVVGSGWGRRSALFLARDPRVVLTAIVGKGSDRSRALAAELKVPFFTELDAAIAAVAPKIAVVAAHESVNVRLVSRLLASGAHVLCAHPVAPDPDSVRELLMLAAQHGVLASTDYSLRLTRAYQVARAELAGRGDPLRLAIESPGRALVVAVDLAADLAGPIDKVFATARYPEHLAERRQQSPKAFPPSVLLEHRSGCVTSIVPMPHADPKTAHRLSIGTESCRIDLALPGGPVQRVRHLGRGQVEEVELHPGEPDASLEELFAAPMRRVLERFLESIFSSAEVHAPFEEEVHIRAIWVALGRSIQDGAPARIV